MIKNYLKTSWRNLVKNKFYSVLNIAGLTIGITSCILIFLYVQFELSYDKYNKQSKNIYRLTGITTLLSKQFIQLVLISAAIAFPLSWWGMHKWLEAFAYRVNIGWQIFIIAGLITLLIALLTVSFQAIRAAVANPVKSLRTE